MGTTYRKQMIRLVIQGIVGFILGTFIVGIDYRDTENLSYLLLFASIFSGIPYGWELSNRLIGNWIVVGNLSIMFLALMLKLMLALVIGWIAYPIRLIFVIVMVVKEGIGNG